MGKENSKAQGRVVPDWYEDTGVWYDNNQVKKAIGCFIVSASPRFPTPFEKKWRAGEVELEQAPQGTMAGQMRAGKAGIPAFFTPTGPSTLMAKGKEVRGFDGKPCVMEYAMKADFAIIRASRADRMGNLIYRGSGRTFNATMAGAATVTIAEVDEILPIEEMDPHMIMTPALYVQRVVQRPPEGRAKHVQKIGNW